MRAADVLAGRTLPAEASELTGQIIQLRNEIWALEASACRPGGTANIGSALQVRQKKAELLGLASRRRTLGGALPPGYQNWWRTWEAHPWTPLFASPWDAYTFVGGAYMAAQPAPKAPNGATFVSQTVPTPMTAGQRHDVALTFRNSSLDSPWTATGAMPYRLGTQSNTWGRNRVDVPSVVAPGEEVTFRFSVTAPARGGIYPFQWQMVQESVEWFGPLTPSVNVLVGENTATDLTAARNAVRLRAWEIWLARGREEGHAWDHWFRAKAELGLLWDIRI
jgi:hypothetical protein